MPPWSATDERGPTVIDWPGGTTWLASPTEPLMRASHALATEGELWLVDPVDAPGIDDVLSDRGTVAGIVLLLDRHRRDCRAFARRYDVPVFVPEPLGDATGRLDVPVVAFDGELESTGYRSRPVVRNRFWREAALVGADGYTVVVAEALGTNRFYRLDGERLGVSPPLRLFPPRRQLGDLAPDRLLVGHGEPLLDDAASAIRTALQTARRRAPRLYGQLLVDALWRR